MLGRDVVANATKFTLNANFGRVIRTRIDGIERCTALWVGVMMIIREVTSAVIKPSSSCVDQSRWIKLTDDIRQAEFRIIWISDLAPAFIVDDLGVKLAILIMQDRRVITYPNDNTGIVPMLLDQDFELSLKLGLLCVVWQDRLDSTV